MAYDEVRATAPPEPTPEQLARAMEQRVLPVIPERLSDPELRLIRQPPASPLADSYRTQSYTFEYDNRRYVLTPEAHGTSSGPSIPPPTGFPAHFVGSWHRGGAPSTFSDCVAAQGELSARLAESSIAQWPATAVAEDRTWFEGIVLVPGLDDGQVIEMGRAAGQPAVVGWDAAGLAVVPTGLRADIPPSTTAWRLEPREVATCPVRKDADPAGRCMRYGGPYGSSAIHAAALWRAHRSVAVTLMGCRPCADGREPIWGHPRTGSPLSLADEIIGSRYGGYTWRAPLTLANPSKRHRFRSESDSLAPTFGVYDGSHDDHPADGGQGEAQ